MSPSAPSISNDLMTLAGVATYARVSLATVNRWRAAGMPVAIDRGRTVRFRLGDVEAWLTAAPPRGSGQPGQPRPQRCRGRPRNVERGGAAMSDASYILRDAETQNFVIVPNETANDFNRLSPAALGILVHILHRPPGQLVDLEKLRSDWQMGRDVMRRIMRQLREAGYARLEKTRGNNGRIKSVYRVASRRKFNKNQNAIPSPGPGLPASGKPASGKPASGKPGLISKTTKKRV